MNLDHAIRTLVVGYGYWGPNIVRNLVERPEFHLAGLCERDDRRIEEFCRRNPGASCERDLDVALADPNLEAVAIATPPHTHYSLVRSALEAGKHVLVEKPLARTAGEAAELMELADELGLVLMPGHTFLYSPSVNKIRNLIQDGTLGEIYFVTSSRMNLGKYQQGRGRARPRAPRSLDPPPLAGQAPGRGDRERPQRLPGRRPRDRVPDAGIRGRGPGQCPGLMAGAAQDAPDGGRRQQADGPVRGHVGRCLGADLRPGHGLLRAAGQLRRVPAHLPHGRHGRAADRGRPSHSASS